MNPDIVVMFSVNKPGSYMIRLKQVELDQSRKYFKYVDSSLTQLDDIMRDIEEESNESNYTTN